MALKELLQTLGELAKTNHLRTPYIVGGIPRDILLGRLDGINDVDITTGSKDVDQLAQLFSEKMGSNVKTMKDGHKKVVADGIAFDFSSNFAYENIGELLGKRGMFHPSQLMKETYSRDFTINTLLMPLGFSEVFDLTGMGKKDLKAKVIRCPVDAGQSLKSSPDRILRAYFYAAKYGMTLDEGLRSAIRENLDLLAQVDRRYASERVNFVLRNKPELLDEMLEDGVLPRVPLTKALTKELIRTKKLHKVL